MCQAFVEYSVLGMLNNNTTSIDLKFEYPEILAKPVLLLSPLNCIIVCIAFKPLASFGEAHSFQEWEFSLFMLKKGDRENFCLVCQDLIF